MRYIAVPCKGQVYTFLLTLTKWNEKRKVLPFFPSAPLTVFYFFPSQLLCPFPFLIEGNTGLPFDILLRASPQSTLCFKLRLEGKPLEGE